MADVFGAPLEVKLLGGDSQCGSFEGYGAVFGNMDSKGDVIEPGAMTASLLERKRSGRPLPPMLKMHGAAMGNAQEPIGIWEEMEEDQSGLRVKGRLIGMDTEQGRWNYAQLRDGALRGLSIGFRARNFRRGSGKAGEPSRYLKTIDLIEVSLVDDPANALAQVYSFKSGFNPREVETALRDAGFSRAEAVKGAAVFRNLCRDGEGPTPECRDDAAAAELVAAIKRATSTLIPTRR